MAHKPYTVDNRPCRERISGTDILVIDGVNRSMMGTLRALPILGCHGHPAGVGHMGA